MYSVGAPAQTWKGRGRRRLAFARRGGQGGLKRRHERWEASRLASPARRSSHWETALARRTTVLAWSGLPRSSAPSARARPSQWR
jgi:hypothetical protein